MKLSGPRLKALQVQGVRNILQAELALSSPVCLVVGANGSGKTSLLEAIWLLGTGRSFRSNRIRSMINYEVDRAVVFGRLAEPDGMEVTLGVARARSGESEFRLNGAGVRATSALAEALPVQLLNPESINLVSGGPTERRRFLDWGTFHVEHRFLDLWKGYRRALEQRNALLRAARPPSGSEFEIWEARIASHAVDLDGMRQRYIDRLRPCFAATLGTLGLGVATELAYRSGWHGESAQDLCDLLGAQRPRDRELGFTRAGPHRAELRISTDGRLVADSFSRGQQKIVASALLLAQGQVLAEAGGRQAVYLVDDLPAELDASFRRRLCAALVALPAQVVITATQSDPVLGELSRDSGIDVFHVEHGRIQAG